MFRRLIVPSVAVATALLAAGPARAVKTPLTPGTAACVKQAVSNRKLCLTGGAAAECTKAYHAAYAACFEQGNGVACATTCEATRTTCENVPQAAEKPCTHACSATRKSALKACAPGDVTCQTAAQTAYATCKKACVAAAAPAIAACRTQFAQCIAQCPGL